MTRISSAKRFMPFPNPWVSDDEQKPPFRPEAPAPVSYCSTMTTSRLGSRSFASNAVQSPVYPAPTMQRSAPTSPMSAE